MNKQTINELKKHSIETLENKLIWCEETIQNHPLEVGRKGAKELTENILIAINELENK